MNDGPEWFAPKSHGLGSGLPIAWQGWAVLLIYTVVLIAAILLLRGKTYATLATTLIATAVLLLICAKTTKGGWRWRWGEKE